MKNRRRNRVIHLVGVLLLCTADLIAQQQLGLLGWSACGAYVAPGEWRSWMCYNLGSANTSADPFTPSWEINGGYWQWGRKEMAAAGPGGPGRRKAKAGEIAGWSTNYAPDGSWSDGLKTLNDPCPSGYRVPTSADWEGVLNYNVISDVGTWEDSSINYSSGKRIGDELFLPASGYRFYYDNGALGGRGAYGYYWSSTEVGSSDAWYLYFDSGETNTTHIYRTDGQSVRCISE